MISYLTNHITSILLFIKIIHVTKDLFDTNVLSLSIKVINNWKKQVKMCYRVKDYPRVSATGILVI